MNLFSQPCLGNVVHTCLVFCSSISIYEVYHFSETLIVFVKTWYLGSLFNQLHKYHFCFYRYTKSKYNPILWLKHLHSSQVYHMENRLRCCKNTNIPCNFYFWLRDIAIVFIWFANYAHRIKTILKSIRELGILKLETIGGISKYISPKNILRDVAYCLAIWRKTVKKSYNPSTYSNPNS